MDDQMEDEIIYQTLLTHARLMSKLLVWANSATMAIWSRQMRAYLLKPEAIACGVFVVFLLTCFNASLDQWCKPWLSKAQLALGVKIKIPCKTASLKLNLTGGARTVWERSEDNAGIYAIQGRRDKMEDRFSVVTDTCSDGQGGSLALYGIFDGHGGDSAAEFVEKTLFKSLLTRIKSERPRAVVNASGEGLVKSTWDFPQLLSEEILAVDKQFLQISRTSKDFSGTTALVAVIHGNKLIVANVGDSRGVLCDSRGNTVPLSFDHKPQQLKELRRIQQAGGSVTFNGVWRVAGILATSRALGDYPLKDRNLIIADPDVLTFDLTDVRPQFMILASDGLWDAFGNEEAVAFIKNRLDEPYFGAKSLTTQAHQRGSLDNITVLVVKFSNAT